MKILFFLFFFIFSAKTQDEFWLQASRFFPPVEEPIEIFFYKGLNLEGQISTYSINNYQNFKHFGPKAKKITDENGLIKVNFIEEGTHIIAIETTANISENRFEYGKMLIQVGTKINENIEIETNQRLEIIPIDNPFGNNTSISFKIMFDKKPLSGLTLQHFTKTNNQTLMSGLHSDKNGVVNYQFTRGLHLLKVIHTISASNKTQSDFETHIASLTFGKK